MQSPRSVDRFEYFPFVPFFQRISNLGIGNIHVYSIKKIIHRRYTRDFYGSVHVLGPPQPAVFFLITCNLLIRQINNLL